MVCISDNATLQKDLTREIQILQELESSKLSERTIDLIRYCKDESKTRKTLGFDEDFLDFIVSWWEKFAM